MKIPSSIRDLFRDQEEKNKILKELVDTKVNGVRNKRWHYESRIKEIQSYALKIESGRFPDPGKLEDFFACTLVVANSSEIEMAEKLILENFKLEYKRPKHPGKTSKKSDQFPFDDLRLYVRLKQNPAMPLNEYCNIIFEFQIKTFLQHAWAIATHDLIYKSDDPNWGKERIAYQAKAMLEHVEVAIQEADNLSKSPHYAKEDHSITRIKEVIAFIASEWNSDDLPNDKRQLANNILNLIDGVGIKLNQLIDVVRNEKNKRGGNHPTNLSPFLILVQYLFDSEAEKITAMLTENDGLKKVRKLLIPAEISLPEYLDKKNLQNAIFV